jgi:hypothetical protein
MRERFCYSDKVIMDQVPRRSQGTSNLESTAQFSAAHQVNAIKEKLLHVKAIIAQQLRGY